MILGAAVGQWLLAPAFGLGEGIAILTSAIFTVAGIYGAKSLAVNFERQSLREVILLRVLGDPIS